MGIRFGLSSQEIASDVTPISPPAAGAWESSRVFAQVGPHGLGAAAAPKEASQSAADVSGSIVERILL